MLDEYRQLYKECADLIPNWKELSTLELANNYLEVKDKNIDYANSFVSAIVCKYWYLIPYYYNRQEYKFASAEDCYEWLIEAVYYTLINHAWTDPNSSIYKDPAGPDKSISVIFSNLCSNFYVAGKRQKRIINNKKLNFTQLLKYDEETEEDCVDRLAGKKFSDQKADLLFRQFIKDKIRTEFNDKQYFNAYALDAIINSNIFSEEYLPDGVTICVDKKRFRRHFKFLGDEFCSWFAQEYSLDLSLVKNSIKYVNNLTIDRFNRNLTRLVRSILKDKDFRIFLDLE